MWSEKKVSELVVGGVDGRKQDEMHAGGSM